MFLFDIGVVFLLMVMHYNLLIH